MPTKKLPTKKLTKKTKSTCSYCGQDRLNPVPRGSRQLTSGRRCPVCFTWTPDEQRRTKPAVAQKTPALRGTTDKVELHAAVPIFVPTKRAKRARTLSGAPGTTEEALLRVAREAAERIRREGFREGAVAAAEIASTYDDTTTHDLRLGDCVLAKMNLIEGDPAENEQRIQRPEDALILGFVLALSEVAAGYPVKKVAKDAAITIALARASGAEKHDLDRLKAAGVK